MCYICKKRITTEPENETKKRKRLCVFQMNHTDINRNLDEYNPLRKIKDMNIFDHIVLAVPDFKENEILRDYAQKWGVKIFFGDIDNVTKRIYNAAKHYGCEIIVRPSIYWFFLDTELIKKMVLRLEKDNSEYVKLPYNFDVKFGAEVFSINLLDRILTIFDKDEKTREKFMLCPWAYADLNSSRFKTSKFTDVPVYDGAFFNKLRKELRGAWPETGVTSDKLYPYKYISNLVKKDYKVLDIACGLGSGTRHLSKICKEVVGVDICPKIIKECKKRYGHLNNMSFIESDVFDLKFKDKSFDMVISIHTMEHVEDDNKFLKKMWGLLKKDGLLALEVPLLMDYPFKGISTPIFPYHTKEYRVQELKKMVEDNNFEIIDIRGVLQSYFVGVEKARGAIMIIAKKQEDNNNNMEAIRE